MSNNSRHSFKMQRKVRQGRDRRCEKLGKQTTAPAPDPQLGRNGEIPEAPDPRTLEVFRRSHAVRIDFVPAEHEKEETWLHQVEK